MPSVYFLPEWHEVSVVWPEGHATVEAIQSLRGLVPEISDLSLQDIFRAAGSSPRYHLGRFPYLRALELQRVCQENGITIELE
jgi:hypothetical protein